MVERPQLVRRQALLGIQSGRAEGRQDPCLDVAGRVVCFQACHERPFLEIRNVRRMIRRLLPRRARPWGSWSARPSTRGQPRSSRAALGAGCLCLRSYDCRARYETIRRWRYWRIVIDELRDGAVRSRDMTRALRVRKEVQLAIALEHREPVAAQRVSGNHHRIEFDHEVCRVGGRRDGAQGLHRKACQVHAHARGTVEECLGLVDLDTQVRVRAGSPRASRHVRGRTRSARRSTR